MKPPVDLTTSLIFRLLLPGVLLAAVLLPVAQAVAQVSLGWVIDTALYFSAGSLLYGTALLWLDMPVYMALEGRRFWPARLLAWARKREQKRVEDLRTKLDATKSTPNDPVRLELGVEYGQYPLSETGERIATKPTRLGNLIDEYELYPTRTYGLDGVFFYDRLLVSIDEDLRKEIDGAQATADGVLYGAAALAIGAAANLVLALVQAFSGLHVGASPTGWHALAWSGLCAAGVPAAYRLSLWPQARFGAKFKALFDQHRDKLKLDETLDFMLAEKRLAYGLALDRRAAAMAVWRFQRWGRGIDPDDGEIKDWPKLPPSGTP